MKRIATIGAVITAFAIAPSLASAGNVAHVTTQVVGTQVASVYRAQAAVSVHTHRVQLAQAQRWTILRAQLR